MSARILVVDDLEPNIKLLEVKLSQYYYEVLTARNGLEALKILEQESVDVVLLDVMMPQMDGFETCARIKNNPKTAHIPVIMVTALSGAEDRLQGLQAGADDFLNKPIVDVALFARIRSLVRLKELTDEVSSYGDLGITLIQSPNLIRSANILLIDEDPLQIRLIEKSLHPAKINIFDFDKNIEEYLNENLDIVIVNTELSSCDALRICAKILNNPTTRNIPILSLIEEDDHEMAVKALDLGISDYIIVPINQDEIKARVITQIRRKKFQDALKYNLVNNINLAQIDSLTGIYNRHHFNEKAAEALKNYNELSLIMIDLDYFKTINDTYGHLVGDEVLKQTAQRIKQSLRSKDLFARFGGEEFILLLPETDSNNAYSISERIRKAIESQPYQTDSIKETISNTASFGIASFKNKDSLETLINRADQALYRAKAQGRNLIVTAE
jgi:two-component system cell cycle response regulator